MTSEATRRPDRDRRPVRDRHDRSIETPTGRFEFAEHNCFACGTLNAGGLGLDAPRRARAVLDRARRSTVGSRAGSGVIHGGILCTILDEVMAWALVGEDNWGVTARMAVDFQAPGPRSGMPIRAEGWITRSRRRIVDTAGHIVDADDRASSSRPRPASTSRPTQQRKRELRERYGLPAGRSPHDDRRRPQPSWPMTPPDPMPRRAMIDSAGRERGDRPRRRVRRRPPRAGRGPRRLAWPSSRNDPDALRDGARPRGLAALADPEYLDGQQRIAPGHRRRSTASAGRSWPPCRAASGTRPSGDRPTPLLFIADRLFHETRARGALVRLRPPRADARRRDGADVAAPPARRARGRRLDHGRLARAPVRQGHRRRALSLGRARAARLQPVALGAPARRLDDRDDDPRRPPPRPRPGGRRPAPCRSSAR